MLALLFIWFLLIFGPIPRSPLGSFADLSLLAALFYLGWSLLRGRRLHQSLGLFCIIAVLLAALAVGTTVLTSSEIDAASVQSILRPIKGLMIFLGLYFAITRLSDPYIQKFGARKTYELLLAIIYVAILIHAVIIVAQFISPALRNLTYQMIGNADVLGINKEFRMPGLAGAGGAQLSATQGLGFLIGVHLALIHKRYVPFIMGNLLLIISFVCTGRTGFVLVVIATLYWWLSIAFHKKQRWRLKSSYQVISGMVAVVVAVVTVSFMMQYVSASYANNQWFERAVNRTFQTYTNYEDTGRLSDSTLTALASMDVMPTKASIWLFGDARLYDNTLGAYRSDLGYIRQWWGYGLLGLSGYISFYLLMGIQIFRRRVRGVMGAQNVAFGLCILMSIFVLNYKEPFFFARMSYPISLVAVMGLWWLLVRSEEMLRTGAMIESPAPTS